MPQNEEIKIVRKKYGLINDEDESNEIHKPNPSKSVKLLNLNESRNYDRERTLLLGAIERIGKTFQKQLAQGDFVLDNDSRFVEEFCTIIELCIQHGWKNSGSGLLKQRDCFWVVLENYGKKFPSKESNQTAYDIVRNHLCLPNNMSKLRAWIRIALTKKILVLELKNALGIVKKIDQCYYKWSVARNDMFNSWLTVISSLNKIDFNLLVKESTLNLSEKSIKWEQIIDSDGFHLERFAPYLNMDNNNNVTDDSKVLEENLDKLLLRQVGFLEDENIRLRRSVLQQLNQNTKSESAIADLTTKLQEIQNYSKQLEIEVQRLQKIKFDHEEQISAHELTNQSLLKQFNDLK